MEQALKICHSNRGIALVTVLFITGIGLLFGAGALLLFRYQCQLRIERQHEMEKVYAVRSALNFIRPYGVDVGSEVFNYFTGSGRDLKVLVQPVANIFPNFNMDFRAKFLTGYPREHLATDDAHIVRYNPFPCCIKDPQVTYSDSQYNSYYDYEYGVECEAPEDFVLEKCFTNQFVNTTGSANAVMPGLTFTNATENTARFWFNIGMRGTGGWLQEEYGRRYSFRVAKYSGAEAIRLCIIQNVTNTTAVAGRIHGWPLSQSWEEALIFEIAPSSLSRKISIYRLDASGIKTYYLDDNDFKYTISFDFYLGMQIAHDGISFFILDTYGTQKKFENTAYQFSSVKFVGSDFDYFSRWYNGRGECVKTYEDRDAEAGESAPELRAVFEVISVAKSTVAISDFRVTPAYQYDISLIRPELMYRDKSGVMCYDYVTNLATVAQKSGRKRNQFQEELSYTMLTYDTHGTENNGWRKDEREVEKKRNRR